MQEAHLRTTLKNWTREKHKYLGIEESFDIQQKNEKEKLKMEYLR